MNISIGRTIGTALLSFAAATAQAAPTITNGDFESGNFDGWTLSGDPDYNAVAPDLPHAGDYAAIFGTPLIPATLSQTISTVSGRGYIVSFWLSNQGAGASNTASVNQFSLQVDGSSLLSIEDKTATDYTLYQRFFTASSTSTSLSFSFRHDDNYWLLDDVATNEVSTGIPPIPEPSSALLLLFGLGALALHRRLR